MASTVWRGHLTFGLISIPIRLFRAGRAERIPLKKVARVHSTVAEGSPKLNFELKDDGSKLTSAAASEPAADVDAQFGNREMSLQENSLVAVRQSNLAKDSGAAIPESAIARAIEVRKNRFVEIPAESLKSLRAATSPDLAIQEFVALSEIDPLYFETSYYVVPEEVGEKAYALLYVSLFKNNVVALAELSMHGRDHIVVVRPGQTGLVAHTMFYSSEVHLDEQFRADESAVNKKERELAEVLIASLTTTFEPEKFKNGYRNKLQALIAERVGEAPERTMPARSTPAAEVIDIADALRRSSALLKKPAQRSAAVETQTDPIRRAKKASRASG